MNTYKINAAVALVAKHGFTKVSIRESAVEENRLVHLRQSWTNKGEEVVEFLLARGRYKQEYIGRATRTESN